MNAPGAVPIPPNHTPIPAPKLAPNLAPAKAPAAAPIEDEFNVTPKTDPKNKMAAIAAAYRAAKERK